MTSEKPVINPRQFAVDYMKVEHRDSYISHLEENDITENQFGQGHTTLVKRQLAKMLIQFMNGVQVIAPHEVYGDVSKIEQLADVKTVLKYWKNREDIRQYEPRLFSPGEQMVSRKNQSTSVCSVYRRKHTNILGAKGSGANFS